MLVNIQEVLGGFAPKGPGNEQLQFSNVVVEPDQIKAVMINEVVPADPGDDFYGQADSPGYLKTTIPLFQKAGVRASTIEQILAAGIYLTNAVKRPKTEYTIPRSMIEESLPFLEKELSLFPNLIVIMLMGDVAKKAFNLIARSKTNKNVIPAMATYKIRDEQFYYGKIRVFPSYIMTGKNILIEKSKFAMAAEDIKRMFELIK